MGALVLVPDEGLGHLPGSPLQTGGCVDICPAQPCAVCACPPQISVSYAGGGINVSGFCEGDGVPWAFTGIDIPTFTMAASDTVPDPGRCVWRLTQEIPLGSISPAGCGLITLSLSNEVLLAFGTYFYCGGTPSFRYQFRFLVRYLGAGPQQQHVTARFNAGVVSCPDDTTAIHAFDDIGGNVIDTGGSFSLNGSFTLTATGPPAAGLLTDDNGTDCCCGTATEACCLPDGSCVTIDPDDCLAQGGTVPGIPCIQDPCPPCFRIVSPCPPSNATPLCLTCEQHDTLLGGQAQRVYRSIREGACYIVDENDPTDVVCPFPPGTLVDEQPDCNTSVCQGLPNCIDCAAGCGTPTTVTIFLPQLSGFGGPSGDCTALCVVPPCTRVVPAGPSPCSGVSELPIVPDTACDQSPPCPNQPFINVYRWRSWSLFCNQTPDCPPFGVDSWRLFAGFLDPFVPHTGIWCKADPGPCRTGTYIFNRWQNPADDILCAHPTVTPNIIVTEA